MCCMTLTGCVAMLAIKGAQEEEPETAVTGQAQPTVVVTSAVPAVNGDVPDVPENGEQPKPTSVPTSQKVGSALGEIGNGIIRFAGEMGTGFNTLMHEAVSSAAKDVDEFTEKAADATVDTAYSAVDAGLEFRKEIIEGGIEIAKEGVTAIKDDIGGLRDRIKGSGEETDGEPVREEGFEEVLEGPFHILSVVDGDTIKLNEYGKDVRFRLIGIDTPESVASEEYLESSGKKNTEQGKDASSFMKSYLPKGTEVYISYDAGHEDRYGRQLIYLWKDGVLVNELLLKEGLAKLFTLQPNVRYADTVFLEAERYARENGRGFWGTGFFE